MPHVLVYSFRVFSPELGRRSIGAAPDGVLRARTEIERRDTCSYHLGGRLRLMLLPLVLNYCCVYAVFL
uniref:Uncharacterized protein n=1 Tax=Hyaloperonospora arabidopsidis (strain Emoy2) TaxID=559515 RepID=M4C5B0_HYAAE